MDLFSVCADRMVRPDADLVVVELALASGVGEQGGRLRAAGRQAQGSRAAGQQGTAAAVGVGNAASTPPPSHTAQ